MIKQIYFLTGSRTWESSPSRSPVNGLNIKRKIYVVQYLHENKMKWLRGIMVVKYCFLHFKSKYFSAKNDKRKNKKNDNLDRIMNKILLTIKKYPNMS